MDNIKMPFLPEETLRTQRVEIYLQDLKDRLKELQLRHKEVIQNSVDIIKEIDEVSVTLLMTQENCNGNEERFSRIKKLIQEFEINKDKNIPTAPKTIESQVDIRQILDNFEKLNESHLLAESLMLFRRAKESFEKIDTYFGIGVKPQAPFNLEYKKLNISERIRDKINKLHKQQSESTPTTSKQNTNMPVTVKKVPEPETPTSNRPKETKVNVIEQDIDFIPFKDTNSNYASCCSSVVSLDKFKTNTDVTKKSESNYSTSLTGYEGDTENSEYDLSKSKPKKNTKLKTEE